ncbi:UNVERIFIED_ORG: hypothetical protein ABIB19_003931 [Arthrobacter sp. UYEF10]
MEAVILLITFAHGEDFFHLQQPTTVAKYILDTLNI